MTILCKICNEHNKPAHSHLTPKNLVNRSEEYISINKNSSTSGSRGSGMSYDKNIICQCCEKRYFNDLDRKFKCFRSKIEEASKSQEILNDSETNPTIYKINFAIDYEWLDTFSASLLYRHSLSGKQKVNLGKYESTAKKMIEKFNKKASISDERKIFSSTCVINTSRIFSKNAISGEVGSYRLSGIRIYKLLMPNGVEIHIKASNQKSIILSKLRDPKILLAIPLNDEITKHIESIIEKSLP